MNHPIYFLVKRFFNITSRDSSRFLLPISPWAFVLDRSRQGLHADLKGGRGPWPNITPFVDLLNPFNFNSHQQGRPFLCVPSSPLFILLVGIFSFYFGGVISQLLLLRWYPGMPSTTSSYALKRSLATVQCTPGWTSENLRSIASQPCRGLRGQKVAAKRGGSFSQPGRQ